MENITAIIKETKQQLIEKNLYQTNQFKKGDIKKAMRNLKNNKEAGTDEIHLELIKYGGNTLLNRIYEPVRQIWEEERISEEWKETIIVPIYKKRK